MLAERPPTPGQDDELVRAILDYLNSHPHAADSAQGVACWWLGAHAGQAPLPRVQAALDALVARQALRQELLPDGTRLYSAHAAPTPGGPGR